MVLPRTPRRAKEPAKYLAHIGEKGRRTGITLKPTARDENGLESIDGLFSSPEKSPVKQTGGNQPSSSDGESMDIGQSTIQGPTEYLGNSRNGTKLPPPRARSPVKTNIGSSPRRSLGPLSSPTRLQNGATPIQSISHPPKLKISQISNPIATPSTDGSIRKGRKPPLKRMGKVTDSSKGKKRAFDLSQADETDDDERVGSGMNGDIDITQPGLDLNGDTEADEYGEVNREVDENRDIGDNENGDEQVEEDKEVEEPPAKRRKGGKRLLSQQNNNKKMKPPKPKPKPAANSAVKRTVPKVKPTENNEVIPRAKSLFAIRSETPADDSGAIRLKSGRTSIKPLAYWKGERVLLGEGRVEGKVHILPSMKEVVRIDEIELSKPKRPNKKSVRSKARKSRKAEEGEEEEEEAEEDEREAWETETGIMHAQVMAWDPVIGKYDEEALEETEIAYAAEAIEMRDINGADFRFAKTLTLPFFGSGMVDLPPGGSKRVKNSRKMQMVFFVYYGRVTVDVGTPTSQFSIGKGGMWQVPRGNFYSINNYSETKPARIFFAQGCEVNVEVENIPA